MPQLRGLGILVTGAGSGIGRAISARFVEEGAEVWCVDRDASALAALREEHAGLHVVVADIADPGAVAAAVADVDGRLDAVVANAGVQLVGEDAPIDRVPLEVWQRTIRTNVDGTFHTLRAAVAKMRSQARVEGSRGSIIVTGSPTGITGEGAGFAAYSCSKAAVHGMARTTAAECAPDGIRVNVVVPGHTLTPLVEGIRRDPEAASMIDARIPLGRPALPEDCTGAYVYLASHDARYVTGASFAVDGGMTSL